jgi:ABC transporter with metal-binding/Fe-S-binding domain ATP-binding protein
MKLAVLFSGGKDSCLALHKVLREGHEVVYLLNVFPKNEDSFMFHKPCLSLLRRQAEELGIKLVVEESEGEKEVELGDMERLIREVGGDVDGIVVGGIASSYQGERIKKICDKLGLKFVAPLWDFSPEDVWRDLLNEEFRVVMTRVACDGLGKEWVGRVIDRNAFEELKKLSEKYKFRIDFEGGEAETVVLFMPGFGKEIGAEFDVVSEGECRHLMRRVRVE